MKRSQFKTFMMATLFVVFAIPFAGCSKNSESEKIADAQDCLDRSTSDTALACMSKVEGLTSSSANLIRCSAYFIDQGFSEASRLSQVVEKLNESGDQDGSTVAALTFMAFSAEKYDLTTNYNLSETAFTACSKSNSGGLIYLSSMTRIATAAMNVIPGYDPTSGVPPTEQQIEDAICDPSRSPATSIAIGSAAQVAYQNRTALAKTSQATPSANNTKKPWMPAPPPKKSATA